RKEAGKSGGRAVARRSGKRRRRLARLGFLFFFGLLDLHVLFDPVGLGREEVAVEHGDVLARRGGQPGIGVDEAGDDWFEQAARAASGRRWHREGVVDERVVDERQQATFVATFVCADFAADRFGARGWRGGAIGEVQDYRFGVRADVAVFTEHFVLQVHLDRQLHGGVVAEAGEDGGDQDVAHRGRDFGCRLDGAADLFGEAGQDAGGG